ncbi:MAG TPA: DNA primase [Streptomyces sp.]|nr:DNA primase [Streptomyces sp.]
MNNRMLVGLAVGGGYLLGRTKKLKLAFAVGTIVAGKKLQLSPRAIAEFASSQLQNNPQFKEIGDQLREDMRGVGKAATGAILTRQINGIADRLHDRTLGVQDRVSGITPDLPDVTGDEQDEDESEERSASQDDSAQRSEQKPDEERGERRRKTTTAARKTAPSAAKKTTQSARGAAKKAPAKKTAAKKTAAKGGRSRG